MFNFKERIEALYAKLDPCTLCPRHCGVNRLVSSAGKCRTGKDVFVASHNVHNGEEPPISGSRGSGTIFFANCNLSCVFCQNYPISQLGNGNRVTIDELAGMMLALQEKGVHNINFVTPSHVVAQLVDAVARAREKGLRIPLVYNCGGYEDLETLRLLDGIIDVYLPDAKYSVDASAERYSSVPHYWETNKLALKEMYRQVGNLQTDDEGIAVRGLIIRHMVLPNDISGSAEVLEFIARELSPDVPLSLMAQYHPAHRSDRYPELARRINEDEYDRVLEVAYRLGLENGWLQEL